MRILSLVLMLTLVVGCEGPPKEGWKFEVGEKVEHASGVQAVISSRHPFGTIEDYRIRYVNKWGEIETLFVYPEEIRKLEKDEEQ